MVSTQPGTAAATSTVSTCWEDTYGSAAMDDSLPCRDFSYVGKTVRRPTSVPLCCLMTRLTSSTRFDWCRNSQLGRMVYSCCKRQEVINYRPQCVHLRQEWVNERCYASLTVSEWRLKILLVYRLSVLWATLSEWKKWCYVFRYFMAEVFLDCGLHSLDVFPSAVTIDSLQWLVINECTTQI